MYILDKEDALSIYNIIDPPWERGELSNIRLQLTSQFPRLRPTASCGARVFPVACSLDDDLVAAVGHPSQGALAMGGLVEETKPLVHSPVAGAK